MEHETIGLLEIIIFVLLVGATGVVMTGVVLTRVVELLRTLREIHQYIVQTKDDRDAH